MAPGRRHVERRLLLLVVEVEAGARLAEDLHDPGEAVPGGDVKAGLLVLQREECKVGLRADSYTGDTYIVLDIKVGVDGN